MGGGFSRLSKLFMLIFVFLVFCFILISLCFSVYSCGESEMFFPTIATTQKKPLTLVCQKINYKKVMAMIGKFDNFFH